MKKHFGLLPTTLLDYPGKVACTVFFHGCNFRCPYCQNASLVINEEETSSSVFLQLLPQDRHPEFAVEEILSFLSKRKNVLEGVCISGGEPTLDPKLPELLFQIKNMGYKIKLDTNGTNPEMLQRLYEGHLIDMIAMDLKSAKGTYAKAAGRPDSFLPLHAIQKSIDFLMTSRIAHEFRTTLVKGIHTQDDVLEMAKWIQGDSSYFLQSFQDGPEILSTVLTGNRNDSTSASSSPVKTCGNIPPSVFNQTGADTSISTSACKDAVSTSSLSSFSQSELHEFLLLAQQFVPNAALRGVEL